MKRIFLIPLLFIVVLSSNGQETEVYSFKNHSYFEYLGGISLGSAKNLLGPKTVGWNLYLRLRFDTPQRDYSIVPYFGANIYSGKLITSEIPCDLYIQNLGVELNKKLYSKLNKKDKTLFYFGGLCKTSWSRAELKTQTQGTTLRNFDDQLLFNTSGFNIGAGGVFRLRNIFFAGLAYDFILIYPKYDENLIQDFANYGYVIDKPLRPKLSSLNIYIGFCVPIRLLFHSWGMF